MGLTVFQGSPSAGTTMQQASLQLPWEKRQASRRRDEAHRGKKVLYGTVGSFGGATAMRNVSLTVFLIGGFQVTVSLVIVEAR